jgi:hypothetical protein
MDDIVKGSLEDVFCCVTLEMDTIRKVVSDVPKFEFYIENPDKVGDLNLPAAIRGALNMFYEAFIAIFQYIVTFQKITITTRDWQTATLWAVKADPDNGIPGVINGRLFLKLYPYQTLAHMIQMRQFERIDHARCEKLIRDLPEVAQQLSLQLKEFFLRQRYQD